LVRQEREQLEERRLVRQEREQLEERRFSGGGFESGRARGGGGRHGTEVEIVQSEERDDGGVEIEIVGRRKLTLISEPELLPGAGYTVGRVSFSEAAEAGGVPETEELALSLQLEPHVEEWQRCVHVRDGLVNIAGKHFSVKCTNGSWCPYYY
jgi:Lon protease-like protein